MGGEKCKWLRHMHRNGVNYCVPGIAPLGVVVGSGDSLPELASDVKKNAEGMSVFFGSCDPDFVQRIHDKYMVEMNKYGKWFG